MRKVLGLRIERSDPEHTSTTAHARYYDAFKLFGLLP